MIEVKQRAEFPAGFRSVPAKPGTVAHDYLSKRGNRRIAEVGDDPRFLGVSKSQMASC